MRFHYASEQRKKALTIIEAYEQSLQCLLKSITETTKRFETGWIGVGKEGDGLERQVIRLNFEVAKNIVPICC